MSAFDSCVSCPITAPPVSCVILHFKALRYNPYRMNIGLLLGLLLVFIIAVVEAARDRIDGAREAACEDETAEDWSWRREALIDGLHSSPHSVQDPPRPA
jgi:hypothetical protein